MMHGHRDGHGMLRLVCRQGIRGQIMRRDRRGVPTVDVIPVRWGGVGMLDGAVAVREELQAPSTVMVLMLVVVVVVIVRTERRERGGCFRTDRVAIPLDHVAERAEVAGHRGQVQPRVLVRRRRGDQRDRLAPDRRERRMWITRRSRGGRGRRARSTTPVRPSADSLGLRTDRRREGSIARSMHALLLLLLLLMLLQG